MAYPSLSEMRDRFIETRDDPFPINHCTSSILWMARLEVNHAFWGCAGSLWFFCGLHTGRILATVTNNAAVSNFIHIRTWSDSVAALALTCVWICFRSPTAYHKSCVACIHQTHRHPIRSRIFVVLINSAVESKNVATRRSPKPINELQRWFSR